MGRTKKTRDADQMSGLLESEPIRDKSLDHPDVGRGLAPEGDMDDPLPRPDVQGPAIGDIIQVTARPHSHTAWIGIVHSVDGELLTCYHPDGNSPRQFKVETGSVEVVGKARLKWNGPLPKTRNRDHSRLDKV